MWNPPKADRFDVKGEIQVKWGSHENESTDVKHGGGATRNSDEVSVMGMERRGCIDQLYDLVNQ